MSAEIIDILSSDEGNNTDTDDDDDVQPTFVKLEPKPRVLLIEESPDKHHAQPNAESNPTCRLTPKKSNRELNLDSSTDQAAPSSANASEDLAESRRRKIDILLNNFERNQFRLQSVETMMDAAQRTRWYRLCNNNNNNNNPSSNLRGDNEDGSPSPSSPEPQHQPFMNNAHSAPGPVFQRPPWFIDPPSGGYSSCSRGASGTYTSRRSTTTTTRATPYKRRYKKKRTSTARRTTSTASKRTPKASSSTSARSSTTPGSVTRKTKVSKAMTFKVKRES